MGKEISFASVEIFGFVIWSGQSVQNKPSTHMSSPPLLRESPPIVENNHPLSAVTLRCLPQRVGLGGDQQISVIIPLVYSVNHVQSEFSQAGTTPSLTDIEQTPAAFSAYGWTRGQSNFAKVFIGSVAVTLQSETVPLTPSPTHTETPGHTH